MKYVSIVNGAREFTRKMTEAGLEGPFVVLVTAKDGKRFTEAVGSGREARAKILEGPDLSECDVGRITFRWSSRHDC
jgi:hypothetical protein